MGTDGRDEGLDTARLAALGTLCGGVAHDLSNPLSYVITNLQFLADLLPSLLRGDGGAAAAEALADVNETLADALEGARRMEDLVRTLRGFARGDLHEMAPVDLGAVVSRTAALARTDVLRRANVVCTTDATSDVVVRANTVALTHATIALLMHASRAVEKAADGASILLHASPAPGEGAELSVLFEAPDIDAAGVTGDVATCRRVVESVGGVLRVSRDGRKTLLTALFCPSAPEAAHAGTLPPRAA
jgi:C4-dicarboxylate-specific signal transduction histidine kinase